MTESRVPKCNGDAWSFWPESEKSSWWTEKCWREFIQTILKMIPRKHYLGNLIFDKKISRINSKKVSFLVQNFETLMRLVVIWGTWSTFYKWKFLKVDGRIFELVCRIEIFLPFPIVTWSVPWYGWTSKRVLTSWLRWWVAPVLKNHASLFSRVEDANMACLCMLLLLLGLLFVGRLSVVTLSRCGHISHTIGIKDS